MGAGRSRARANATRWRSPELSVRPSWPSAVKSPAGRLASRSVRPTASSTRCRSSSDVLGAPRRRFSASVALKRWGRWGNQEKWPLHAATPCAVLARPSKVMMPSLGSTKRSNAANTVDFPAPDGPVRATRVPGGLQGDARQCRLGAVVVAHTETRNLQTAAVVAVRGHGSGGAGAGALSRRGRDGRGEDLDDPCRGRLPFGAGVELGAGPARRNEDLGRHEEDRHGGLEPELAPEEAQPEHHGDEADAEAGNHVHGEGRQECDAERAHGGRTHAFCRCLDLTPPLRLPAEGAQGGKPFDELQESTGERAQSAPLTFGAPGRLASEGDHRGRDGQDQGNDDHK